MIKAIVFDVLGVLVGNNNLLEGDSLISLIEENKDNLSLFLLSNSGRGIIERHESLKKFFNNYVKEGFFVSDDDISKPEKEAFLQITEKYNLKPEEVIFVDDNYGYIDVASSLHFNTILHESSDDTLRRLREIINNAKK